MPNFSTLDLKNTNILLGSTSRNVPSNMNVYNFMLEYFNAIGMGSIITQTTTNNGMTLVSNGTTATWAYPNKLASWTTAARPATPSAGMIGLNTTLAKFEGYDGAAWVALH